MRSPLPFVCLSIAPLAGCVEPELVEVAVQDSTGESFFITCRTASCGVNPVSEDLPLPSCADEESPGYSFFIGRFIEITSACINDDGTFSSLADWARPAVCTSDTDCPTLLNGEFECRVGLCQNVDLETWPTEPVHPADAWLLCLGPISRAQTIDDATRLEAHLAVEERVEQACGSDPAPDAICALPLSEECLQPL